MKVRFCAYTCNFYMSDTKFSDTEKNKQTNKNKIKRFSMKQVHRCKA